MEIPSVQKRLKTMILSTLVECKVQLEPVNSGLFWVQYWQSYELLIIIVLTNNATIAYYYLSIHTGHLEISSWKDDCVLCVISHIIISITNNLYNEFAVRCAMLSACDFTKINTPSWLFFTFFKLYKWYQIAQRITFVTFLKNLLRSF